MTLRPALFASAFHPHVGGVEELVRQLAKEQLRRGLHPTVVTMRHPATLPANDVHDGIEVLRHIFATPGPTWRHFAGWTLRSAATRAAVIRQLRERDSDLVHVQCVSGNARYAVSAARRLRVPLVVTMQGELTMDATGIYQRSAQLRRTWRRALHGADVVTGCSQFVLDEAQAHLGRPLPQAIAIPNGIRLADFEGLAGSAPERPYVLGLGRMVAQKGFDLLLDAFENQVHASHPDLELVLAGDGPERAALQSRAAISQAAARIRFLGGVDRRAVVALLGHASAFVLPSRHEPQGIVVLEAMAARTPVVAARVGGVPETVRHGENGLLFEGSSDESLAEQLVAVLDDAALAASLARQGRGTAEQHDWSLITDRYADVYRVASAH